MTKKAFIIHGWGGSPKEGWFPWLKQELEEKGFIVEVLSMPNPDTPEINTWVSFLKEKITSPDEDILLIGHSIGCQTILRYLETLQEGIKIRGAVLVAGWVNLKKAAIEAPEDAEIAQPWLETPIQWDKVKQHTQNFIAMFSDNDPWVPIEDSEIFKEKLGAKIIIEKNKGHIGGEDNIKELQPILDEILNLI